MMVQALTCGYWSVKRDCLDDGKVVSYPCHAERQRSISM